MKKPKQAARILRVADDQQVIDASVKEAEIRTALTGATADLARATERRAQMVTARFESDVQEVLGNVTGEAGPGDVSEADAEIERLSGRVAVLTAAATTQRTAVASARKAAQAVVLENVRAEACRIVSAQIDLMDPLFALTEEFERLVKANPGALGTVSGMLLLKGSLGLWSRGAIRVLDYWRPENAA